MKSIVAWIFLTLAVLSCADKGETPYTLTEFSLSEPLNDAKEISVSPTFKWNGASDDPVDYLLEIARDDQFAQVDHAIKAIRDTFYTVDFSLLSGATYFWRVTVDERKQSDRTFSFTTEFLEPAASPNISNYYVASDGVDDPQSGSESQPFKTVAYAARFVPPGEDDTIIIGPGEFYETEPIVIPLGVNLIGAGVGSTTLKSDGVSFINENTDPGSSVYKENPEGTLIQLLSENLVPNTGALLPNNGNQRLSGFSIDGMDKKLKAGIWVQNRNNVEIDNVNIIDCDFRGVVVTTGNQSGAGSHFLSGIKVHDCYFENSSKDVPGETLGNLCLSSLDGAEIYNIDIKDEEGYGIKFFIRGYFKNCKFHDITTDLNEYDETWGEKISIELWNLGPGNEIYNVEANTWISLVNDQDVYGTKGSAPNVIVHDVLIIDNDGTSDKEAFEIAVPHAEIYDTYTENKGFGFALWNMGRENILIRNNIIRCTAYQTTWNRAPGIYIDNSTDYNYDNIRIFNNVFEKQRFAVLIKGDNIKDVFVQNNLIIESEIKDVSNQTGAEVTFTNNFKWHSSASQWSLEGITTDTDNLSGDPLIRSIGDAWDTYYRPGDNSPLVDAGTDVGQAYQGNAPDVGFYELR